MAGQVVLTHLPNLISLARLALGVLFPLLTDSFQLPVVAVAAASDYADGALSRLLGVAGGIGKHLDPIADKVFVVGVLLTLLARGLLTPGEVFLLSLRDLIVILGVIGVLLFGPRRLLAELAPSRLGKLTTVCQFAFLLVVLWQREPAPILLGVTATLSGLAGLDYLRIARQKWRRLGSEESSERLQ
jgi:cardiolipin synthase